MESFFSELVVSAGSLSYDDILEHLYNRLNELQTAAALSKKTNKTNKKTIDSRSV